MTAIEELRKKLDELGIEHDHLRGVGLNDRSVVYESKGVKWVTVENPKTGMLNLTNYVDELSLEQVIRATIGEEPTSACDDNELLPCPFCGGIPVVGCGYHYDYDGGNRYYAYSADVECCCGCTLHVEHNGPKEYVTDEHMLDFAIAAWNRRAGK